MAKITTGWVQVNNSYPKLDFLPLSTATLQAYAEKKVRRPEDYEFLLPIHSRISPSEAVEKLLPADVVFFSAYSWNINSTLEIARRLKKRDNEKLIVFGGPHVPERAAQAEKFIRTHPFIDIACYGEGEPAVVSILDNFRQKNWRQIASAYFTERDGRFVQTPRGARLAAFQETPSPFLEGVFDPSPPQGVSQ